MPYPGILAIFGHLVPQHRASPAVGVVSILAAFEIWNFVYHHFLPH